MRPFDYNARSSVRDSLDENILNIFLDVYWHSGMSPNEFNSRMYLFKLSLKNHNNNKVIPDTNHVPTLLANEV